jgi:ABC-2 type transport system permease protein
MNWEQLKTILWLRWRLTGNQWRRTGGLGAVFAAVILAAGLGLGTITFAGGLLSGALAMREGKPDVIMLVWLGVTAVFLFFWLIGLLSELQRSETIDLQRLLHLPVALGQLFVVNYLASLASLSIVLALPAMTGLALGLTYSRGIAMLLLLPLSWSMVFMVSAWTYCLRGWLAALMNNPRRRRAIIMGITAGFILLGQLPNLYINVLGGLDRSKQTKGGTSEEARRERREAEQARKEHLMTAQKFVPPLWVSYGALTLAEHRVLPAILGTIGCFGLGVLGLKRAYRHTLNAYQGVTTGKPRATPAETATASAAAPKTTLIELRLPIVPEQAAAVALGTFKSMQRAPEVKMALGTGFLVTLILCAMVFFRAGPKIPEVAKPFAVTGSMAFSLFMLVQFFANQFGFDRQGFRAYVLSPIDRRLILFGKNLATWPVGAVFGLVLLMAQSFWLKLPIVDALAALFQLVTLLLLGSLGGNLLSILVPFRVQAGSLKPTKMPALAAIIMVVCQMLFPIIMVPVFAPPLLELLWRYVGWPALVPVNLIGSVIMAALTALFYWQTLGSYGRLLQQREIKILNTVTAEQE